MKKENVVINVGETVRRVGDVQPKTDICGEIWEFIKVEDGLGLTMALVKINAPSIPHYHKRRKEAYHILSGAGRLIIGPNTYELEPEFTATIPPYVCHYVIPRRKKVVAEVVTIPGWSSEDQFVVEEKSDTAYYSCFKEKFELIDEILLCCDLEFDEEMSREEREKLDLDRQNFVLTAGLNKMSIPELRKLLAGSYIGI